MVPGVNIVILMRVSFKNDLHALLKSNYNALYVSGTQALFNAHQQGQLDLNHALVIKYSSFMSLTTASLFFFSRMLYS